MYTFWSELVEHVSSGGQAGWARLVTFGGSSPRELGATMCLLKSQTRDDDEYKILGSISGGCIEVELVETLQKCIADQIISIGDYCISDEDAFAVGLSCGGSLKVLCEPVPPASLLSALSKVSTNKILLTLVNGSMHSTKKPCIKNEHIVVESVEESINLKFSSQVQKDLRDRLEIELSSCFEDGRSCLVELTETQSVFLQPFLNKPRIVIFGAMDFAAALCAQAKLLGFETIVCDPREKFATRDRFTQADQLINLWPQEFFAKSTDLLRGSLKTSDAVCVLTHDQKFDIPAIVGALKTKVGYIGAMGSRKTDVQRRQLLIEAGVLQDDLIRLYSPIGLNLGGRKPEEVALSIMAEIVRVNNSQNNSCYLPTSLSRTDDPIHKIGGL